MKKSLITIILLLILGSCLEMELYANNNLSKKELLRQLNQSSPNGTERLLIYYELSKTVTDSEVEFYYINKLMQEAELQNNNEYKCRAYLCRMIFAYNQFDVAEVNRWMRLLEPIAKKEKYYDLWFLGRRCVIDMFQINDEFEREEKEANKMLRDATKLNNTIGIIVSYQCLSNVYRATYRADLATEVLKKAYSKACDIKDQGFILELNNSLMMVYEELKDNENWLMWIRTMDRNLQQIVKKNPSSEARLQGWLLMNSIAYLSYYTKMGNMQNAAISLIKAEKYSIKDSGIYEALYRQASYDYYYKAKLWEQALNEIDKLAEIYNRDLSLSSFTSVKFKKAGILHFLGREDEGLELYRKTFLLSDSINVVTINKQTEQLKKDYDTEQYLLEKERINRNIQTLFLVLVVLVILILISFIVHTYQTGIKLRKAENDMRKMAEDMELANVAKEKFLSTISTSISEPLNDVVKDSLRLATDEVTDEQGRKEISVKLNKTSAELMELINNILGLSKLEAGMMKFHIEDVEILPFIKGLLTMKSSDGQKIKWVLPDLNSGLQVNIDIAKLGEVLNNLLFQWGEEISLELSVNEKMLYFCVTGTILAAEQEQSQKIAVANEVNRLLVEHFGGHYEIHINNPSGSVNFTLPLI